MVKKLLNIILGLALMLPASLLPITSVQAATVNEVVTPPSGWGAPNATVLAIAQAGGDASAAPNTDTTFSLRNAPSTNFNPGLNAQPLATGTDNTVHEIGAFAVVSTATNCPSSTPVTVAVGPSVSTIVAMSGTIPNPASNNSSHALFDVSGPSTPYLSVSSNTNVGSVFTHPGGSYATTFGNLSNLFVISNVEIIEGLIFDPPNGSQANTTETLPSVTLTYDDANCANATVNQASSSTPVLADTGGSTRLILFVAFALVTSGIFGIYGLNHGKINSIRIKK